MKKSKSGFTIVELLIVIVIIGILAAITVVAYNGFSARARDSQRKNDLKSIQNALQLHYVDKNSYTAPENLCTDTSYGAMGGCGSAGGTGNWDANSDLRDLVTDKYIPVLPIDPVNDSTYNYQYEPHQLANNGFDGFNLCARLEVTGTDYCLNKRI